jgi:hypothetical protein
MTDLIQLQALLRDAYNDTGTPTGIRNDLAIALEGVEQMANSVQQVQARAAQATVPAPPAAAPAPATWMAETGTQLELVDPVAPQPEPAKPSRRDMTPIAGWIVDSGVAVDRFCKGFLGGVEPFHALGSTLQGVKRGSPLGDRLHMQFEELAQWYTVLRAQLLGEGGK